MRVVGRVAVMCVVAGLLAVPALGQYGGKGGPPPSGYDRPPSAGYDRAPPYPRRDDRPPPLYYSTRDPQKWAAVHACTDAIEAQGNAQAPWAVVTAVTTVVQVGSRFTIHGRVMLAGAPGERAVRHVFRCRLVPGLIQRATIDEPI